MALLTLRDIRKAYSGSPPAEERKAKSDWPGVWEAKIGTRRFPFTR